MKGRFLLILTVGGIYYLSTNTTLLDTPISIAKTYMQQVESKLDNLTGTRIIRKSDQKNIMTAELEQRISTIERKAVSELSSTPATLADYQHDYCGNNAQRHPILSLDNQRYICRQIN